VHSKPRYVSIDTARGLALAIMVFYHAWRWLVPPAARDDSPHSLDWWLCSLRLAAAPLFLLTFGCVLGLVYSGQDEAMLRRRLWPRALQIFIVYKLLCFAELWVRGVSWRSIHAALTYQDLSNWYQVLNFYAMFLALSPWLLRAWKPLGRGARLTCLLVLAGTTAVGQRLDWPTPVLQGLLVGREPYVNYPILPWCIPALIGVWIGERWRHPVSTCLSWATALFACFLLLFWGHWGEFDRHIVFSGWKNPPALSYICIATAAALCWLALCQRLGAPLSKPLQRLGQRPLSLYFFHVLFILMVFGMTHRHAKTDPQGWVLAGVTLLLTYLVSFLPVSRGGGEQRGA
jgi:surface polysaccharide O-acyltransferase-like enzyme